MAGVAEADDLAAVKVVVFAQRGDAAGGRPKIHLAQRLDRHPDPARDDECQGATVCHDDLVLARAPQDLVHGRVDAPRERPGGLGAPHTHVVPHPVPDGWGRDEPHLTEEDFFA